MLTLLMSALAGCYPQVGWDPEQVRSHLAEDFRVGMPSSEVIDILGAYPTAGQPALARWPSEEEWEQRAHSPYEPWRWNAYVLTHSAQPLTGPVVIVADIRYFPESSWSPMAGTVNRADPGTIWFELTGDNALWRWGYTHGNDMNLTAFFPERPTPGDR
jgi:hypothetical protein